jgi:hypothetical protein
MLGGSSFAVDANVVKPWNVPNLDKATATLQLSPAQYGQNSARMYASSGFPCEVSFPAFVSLGGTFRPPWRFPDPTDVKVACETDLISRATFGGSGA